jgi:hypothetical protein
VELLERRLLSLHASKDLLCHPLEGLVLFLFAVLVDLDVPLLPWIGARVEESLEVLLEGLFPQERFIAVGGKELVRGI